MMEVKDIMSEHLVCLKPDATIAEISKEMASQDIGAIPICDEEHHLLGIVTDRDLVIRGYAKNMSPDDKVEHCMTQEMITCTEDMSVMEVGELMAEHQIRRLPVIKDKKIIGIVSLSDLALEEQSDHIAAEALEDISEDEQYH